MMNFTDALHPTSAAAGLTAHANQTNSFKHKEGEVRLIQEAGSETFVYYEFGFDNVTQDAATVVSLLGISDVMFQYNNSSNAKYVHAKNIDRVFDSGGLKVNHISPVPGNTPVSENYVGTETTLAGLVAAVNVKAANSGSPLVSGGTSETIAITNSGDGAITVTNSGSGAVDIDNTGTGAVDVDTSGDGSVTIENAGDVTITSVDDTVVNNSGDGAVTMTNGDNASVTNSGSGDVTITNN